MFLKSEKIKKGFSLVEIIIVLVTIGVVSALTVPLIFREIFDIQCRVQYKTSFRKIASVAAGEGFPVKAGANTAAMVFNAISDDIGVKGYVSMEHYKPSEESARNRNVVLGEIVSSTPKETPVNKNWILAEDSVAYYVTQGAKGTGDADAEGRTFPCRTKEDIIKDQSKSDKQGSSQLSSVVSDDDLSDKACFVVYVDVNGPANGPNELINNKINQDSKVETIVNDIFPIYIGSDGAVAGNQMTTITGRIAANLK